MKYLSTLGLVLLLGLMGCDVIEAPYVELSSLPADERCVTEATLQPAFPNGTTFEKRVLLEEMTGHKCGNCPRASEKAFDLVETYGDRVVLVTIHAGPLATYNESASKYFSNYNTAAGDEFYQELNTSGAVPFGMVDRIFSGNNANDWADQVATRLAEPATAGIRIYNCYNADSLTLNTVIDVKYLTAAPASERLCVQLVEDKIVDWQKDYSAPNGTPDIENYTHHDIFRAAINGTWGQPLSTEAIVADQTFTNSYSFQLSDSFDATHCKVVAYVYDFDTKEVRQVASSALVP